MKQTTLDDITLNIVDGVHGDCTSENGSGYYFISVKDMDDFEINYSSAREISKSDFLKANKRTRLENNDVLFANTGDTIGKMLRITPSTAIIGNTTFQKSVAILKPDIKKIDPLYFYYLIKNNTLGLRSAAVGSGQKNLLLGDMREYKVSIAHNRADQKNIALVLANMDKKIEMNKRINDNLQQQIATIYSYWFHQYNYPDANGKPYKSSGGKLVRNNTLKRDIPSNWNIATVASNPLCSFIKPGVEPFTSKTYLATADINGINIGSGNPIDYETRESRANMQPTINSVWFAKMKNSIKHLYINEELLPIMDNTVLSTGLCGLQCSATSFEYVSSYISDINFEKLKDIYAHGATQEAVNNEDLDGINILIPDQATLEKYHEIMSPIYAALNKNIVENMRLSNYRNWLLPMLMNGQVTIAD